LREAEAGFETRLFYRAGTKIDSWEAATFRLCVRRN